MFFIVVGAMLLWFVVGGVAGVMASCCLQHSVCSGPGACACVLFWPSWPPGGCDARIDARQVHMHNTA